MRYSIVVLGPALEELDRLWDIDEDAAADIEEWLDRFELDEDLLETLSVHDYGAFGTGKPYHVSKWKALYHGRPPRDIWRFKLWQGPGSRYRTVYGFQPRILRYNVLGIPPRDFDYNISHPISKRMIADYDDL